MRQREGWTQRELAQRAGLDVQRVSQAERSLNPARISAGTVLPLASAYGVDPSEIIADEPLGA
jgi:transcriptional regulator with XRE-family HTH domain